MKQSCTLGTQRVAQGADTAHFTPELGQLGDFFVNKGLHS